MGMTAVLIWTLAALIGGGLMNGGLAMAESSTAEITPSQRLTSDALMPIVSTDDPNLELSDAVEVHNPGELIAQDEEFGYIQEVQIRFVNSQGETIDQQTQPRVNFNLEDFVRSELKLKAGDRYSKIAVRRDLQQLRQLGIFSQVTVTTQEVGTDLKLIYNITPSSRRVFSFAGGYNDDIGVYVGVGVREIIGRTQKLSVTVQPSLRDFEYNLRFTSPYLASSNRLGYSIRTFRDRRNSEIFNQELVLPNGNNVREIRMGGNLSVNRPIGDWQATLGLNYTNISTRDRNLRIARRDEAGNRLTWSGTGVDELYTVSLGLTRDWRDNPFEPSRGAMLSLSTEQSIPLGQGEIVLNRLLANYTQYMPMHWIGIEDPQALPEMFAFNLQAGTVFGDLPPTEAFRLGGSNTVRGYTSGDIGSGRSYFLASGEYRFPLKRDIGGVVFVDFASDLGSGNSVLGKPAVIRDKPGTGASIGVGLRVRSSLGLIRFDIGVGDRGDVRFILRTGQRF
jgi:outer membrane protein insertion porin family